MIVRRYWCRVRLAKDPIAGKSEGACFTTPIAVRSWLHNEGRVKWMVLERIVREYPDLGWQDVEVISVERM